MACIVPKIGKLIFYFQDVIVAFIWIAGSFILGWLISFIVKAITRKKEKDITLQAFGTIFILSELIVNIFFDHLISTATMKYVHGSVFLLLMILGIFGYKYLNESEKRFWLVSVTVSLSDMAAVMFLTNLSMITALQYLVPAGVVSFIPGSRLIAEKKKMEHTVEGYCYSCTIPLIIALLVVLHRGIIVRDYSDGSDSIFGMESIVKNGPAKGVVCGYMSAYTNKVNAEEWPGFVNEGENILVVGPGLYDPIVYFFRSAGVSNYSTIDTPTYDENLLDYWRDYPGKKPDVVAVECWYGDMRIDADSFIMEWTRENCDYLGDGSYYRFYRVVR